MNISRSSIYILSGDSSAAMAVSTDKENSRAHTLALIMCHFVAPFLEMSEAELKVKLDSMVVPKIDPSSLADAPSTLQ